MSSIVKKVLFIVAVILISYQSVSMVYQYRGKFFSRGYEKSYADLKEQYNRSQYVKKKDPFILIDESFEQFAAGAFLKGLNPILIVHDHPPLARYIVALSIVLFDNAHTIIIPTMLLIGLGVFFISQLVLKNAFLALIPTAIFVNEPIYLNKLLYTPLPEPIQLVFVLFAIYFFLKGITNKHVGLWFALTSLMLGGVISTRFFVLGAAMTAAMILYLLITYRGLHKVVLYFIFSLPLALVVLILSYFRTILDGTPVWGVFSIQKYILDYHKTKFILPLSFWDLLLFNRWHTWWGNRAIATDPQWLVLWPISTVITFLSFLFGMLKKITLTEPEKVLLLWIGIHMIMLSTGYTSTRYFLPFLPFLYILSTSFIVKVIRKYVANKAPHASSHRDRKASKAR